MKRILVLILAVFAGVIGAQVPIAGQQVVGVSPIYWGLNNSSSLYVTSTGYFRDSAGVRRPFDTTATVGVGGLVPGPGACSNIYTVLTNSAIGLQSNFELSYGIRATDPAEYGVEMYFATRNRLPSGTDSTWRIIHTAWDTTRVRTWVTPKNPTATRSYRAANFYLSGQDVRLCVKRVAPMLGAGDTTIIDKAVGRLR